MTTQYAATATHPHIVFRLAWFHPDDPMTVVDHSIHLTTGSVRACAAAMAKDAPELRAYGTRAYITDAVREQLDKLASNPVPWLSLDERFFIAGPPENNTWWTAGIGPNVVPLPGREEKAVEQAHTQATTPQAPITPAAVVEQPPPPPMPYTPIAPAAVAYAPVSRPEPRPLPDPPPAPIASGGGMGGSPLNMVVTDPIVFPPATPVDKTIFPPATPADKPVMLYAVKWIDTRDGGVAMWTLHGDVGSVFTLSEKHMRDTPWLRPSPHQGLVSQAIEQVRKNMAYGLLVVRHGEMAEMVERLAPCDAPWVDNLLASYVSAKPTMDDLWERGQPVVATVPAATPTVVPDGVPTPTEVEEALVAVEKEATLPTWLQPKAPPPAPTPPPPPAPPVLATGEDADKPKRGRKTKAAVGDGETPAPPAKRARKPAVAKGETGTLPLSDDPPSPPAPVAPPLAAVQGPPQTVPADTWDKPGAIEGATGLDVDADIADVVEAAECEQDEKLAVARIHIKRAIGRVRLAAHALPMATHDEARESLMAMLGRLSVILHDMGTP